MARVRRRARTSGAAPSAGAGATAGESAIFELLDRRGTDLFNRMLPIVQ